MNNNSKSTEMTYHNVANHFQTTIRNVGLYTSISLGFLGYSRYYRGKNKLYNIGPLLVSMCFNILSLLFLNYLLIDHKKYLSNIQSSDYYDLIHKWYIIPRILIYIIFIVLLFSLYTFYKQVMPGFKK